MHPIPHISLLDRKGQSSFSQNAAPMSADEFLAYRWNRPKTLPETEHWIGLLSYDDSAGGLSTFTSSRFWRASMVAAPWPSPHDAVVRPHWQWAFLDSDADYLGKVASIIEEIGCGHFYQLNLCRYLKAQQDIPTEEIACRLAEFGGPFSAWIVDRDLELVSFSPEEFIRIAPAGLRNRVTVRPIKGTAPRHADAELDGRLRDALVKSLKDRAELTMIIDLMRNDLLGVCDFGSVKVLSGGDIASFANVHHLVGEVTGLLREGASMHELLHSLCPSGSITGAPKRAVMRAIAGYEGRQRGHSMGNLVVLHPQTGELRSSVLIRTMWRNHGRFEFGVGSGIVIKSEPASELAELKQKARVVWNF